MKKELLFFIAYVYFINIPNVSVGQTPNLGTTSSFALFTAKGAFTNVGATVVLGDIGTNIGAFSGFPPGTVIGQTRLPGNTQAIQAAIDVQAVYDSLTSAPCNFTIGPSLGNGQTFTPGVYCQNAPAAASNLNGTLTLDGPGLYIIKLNDALTTTAGSTISLINGASIDNVFFQVNGAVDVGIGSLFRGNILANGAISLLTDAALEGRGLSIGGAITLSNNRVTNLAPALSVSITAGACNSVNNAYALTGTISITAAVASTLTITDGISTTTISVTAGQTSASFSLSALNAGTGNHLVTVSGSGYSLASTNYMAPASCNLATLGGSVFTDINQDGLQNGADAPRSGVVVTLLNGSNQPITSTTTNLAGLYSFSGLTPGLPYSVSFTPPAGYSLTTANVNGVSGPVTLTPGEVNTALGAGVTVLPATLGGSVFTDINQDGLQNGADAPLSGVVVTLLNGSNQPITSTTTNLAGLYSFSGLTPGVPYSVSFSTPAGYSATTLNVNGISGPVTLTAGGSQTIVGTGYYQLASTLTLTKFVDKSRANIGDQLTYIIVLTNSGSSPATNIVVRDSTAIGLTYVANSASAPVGTTFTLGSPISSWSIAAISVGQSLSLSIRAIADSSGILYNRATIPGQVATVCTSIPSRVCVNEPYTFALTAPTGRSSYRWFKDNVEIIGQATNVLNVTAIGAYSLAVNDVLGLCPDFSCCPFIVEEDTLPTFQARAVPASCISNTAQVNGQIILSGFNTAYTYQYSLGSSFNSLASLSGPAKTILAGGLIVSNLANPVVAQAYTIRVFNSSGCYTDVTVMLMPTICTCPAAVCIPIAIRNLKPGNRSGLVR